MLETDEVDDDYFTPASSTTLANIFGSSTKKELVNDSLKYTPPKKHVVHNVCKAKLEDSKATECIFACALTAYEWIDNNYTDKGKVGFAIVKVTKTNSHNIVLYNSNKMTLSSTPVTSKLNITVKGNNYICYYDIFFKYWSLNTKEDDIKTIAQLLGTLGVDIKYEDNQDHNLPAPSNTESEITIIKSDKESDTDSSANRKTKISILNRMANMGHSVLPPSTAQLEKSSDSSDTTDTVNLAPKIARHKPGKSLVRRLGAEKSVPDSSELIEAKTPLPIIEQQIVSPTTYTIVNGQIVPVSNANIITNFGNHEMTLFMSEQRMNNNELRMNINRTTDKVDQVLDKVKNLEYSFKTKPESDTQITLMQKLLVEYENKIKVYEQMFKNRKQVNDNTSVSSELLSSTSTEFESYETQISELKRVIVEKEKAINKLTEKLNEHELVKEIAKLKISLASKTEEIENISRNLEESSKLNNAVAKSSDFDNKLKETMNDVFRAISINFENEESYSGENVKSSIASIIKKVTLHLLSENYSEK